MKLCFALVVSMCMLSSSFGEEPTRTYRNVLKPLDNPEPLLADHPEFVEPVRELRPLRGSDPRQRIGRGPLGAGVAVLVQRTRHRRDA